MAPDRRVWGIDNLEELEIPLGGAPYTARRCAI